jgi:hypothetical protein
MEKRRVNKGMTMMYFHRRDASFAASNARTTDESQRRTNLSKFRSGNRGQTRAAQKYNPQTREDTPKIFPIIRFVIGDFPIDSS